MNRIINALRSIPVVGRHAFATYYRLRGRDWDNPSVRIAAHIGPESCMVVQIGSHNGETGDPIHELLQLNPKWKALFVEPIPHLFQVLTARYSGRNGFRFENSIIDSDGTTSFFTVRDQAFIENPSLPVWCD
jgi:hypothetical protein